MRLLWLTLAATTRAAPEACINSFTEVASNAVARSGKLTRHFFIATFP